MNIHRIAQAVVKRIPPHAKDRIEETLLGLRDFERLATPKESALTIICDDGELKDLDVVEVLNERGVKGVFAVSPDLIGRPGFLSYDQLRAIRAAGHEIAFHGTTHDAFTSFGDSRSLLESVRDGMRRLHVEGLGAPSTLIYPFGSNSRAVRQSVSTVFDCAFTTWYGLNERRCNRYAIRRVPFGAYTGRLPATEDWYRSMLDRCAGGQCWPALMLHPSGPGHEKSHDALLGRLIDHARERGMSVRTVSAHLAAQALTGPSSRAAGTVGSR
jgi:peptidoglycan/xylan/chitin deacetylase (PgdA/CDA1 family)